jgi:hypothetical protein
MNMLNFLKLWEQSAMLYSVTVACWLRRLTWQFRFYLSHAMCCTETLEFNNDGAHLFFFCFL